MQRRSASRLSTTHSTGRTADSIEHDDDADDDDKNSDDGISEIRIGSTGEPRGASRNDQIGISNQAQSPPSYRSERTGDFQFRIHRQPAQSSNTEEVVQTSSVAANRVHTATRGTSARLSKRKRPKYKADSDSDPEEDELESTGSIASNYLESSKSLTPLPPESTPPPPPPPIPNDSSMHGTSVEAGPSGSRSSYNPPERNADGSRRYTAKEKGKGKARARQPINVDRGDDNDDLKDRNDRDDRIEVIDVTDEGRKRKRASAMEVVEVQSSQESMAEPKVEEKYVAGKGSVKEQGKSSSEEAKVVDKRKVGVEEEKALASYSQSLNSQHGFPAYEQHVQSVSAHQTSLSLRFGEYLTLALPVCEERSDR